MSSTDQPIKPWQIDVAEASPPPEPLNNVVDLPRPRKSWSTPKISDHANDANHAQTENAAPRRKKPLLPPEPTPATQEDPDELSTRDRLYLLFENGAGSLTALQIAQRLDLSPRRVRELLREEKAQKGNRLRIKYKTVGKAKTAHVSMRQGESFHRVSEKPETVRTIYRLPAGMDQFLGTDYGGELKDTTFLGICGYTDSGKSQALINLAVDAARQRKRVIYLRHESDDFGFFKDVGRRLLGRNIQEKTEAIEAMKAAGIYDHLTCYVAPDEADLDEFCEEVLELAPDVLVYDYLSQELVALDVPEQRSVIATIVHKLGNDIVHKGIMLLTAVQVESDKDFAINPKWLRRMNIALRIYSVKSTDAGLVFTFEVKKNKQGGLRAGDYIRVRADPKTWEFVASWNATEEVLEERLVHKKPR